MEQTLKEYSNIIKECLAEYGPDDLKVLQITMTHESDVLHTPTEFHVFLHKHGMITIRILTSGIEAFSYSDVSNVVAMHQIQTNNS